MRYWDTSALVPLLVSEPGSTRANGLFGSDPDVVTWWGTAVECVSALARLEREGAMDHGDLRHAGERLDELERAWVEVQPSDRLRAVATRLLRVHALRAADALHLAAAHVVAEGAPATLEIVTFDDRLALAAEREGFRVLPGEE